MDLIKRHRIGGFFVLAYALAWGAIPWNSFFAPGVLLAALIVMAATAIMAILIAGWHAPLFIMPVFGAHPIRVVTTMAVTFWYAWLFNRASGSALLTLIAHGTEGAVLTRSLWPAGADLERLIYLNTILWCVVALALLGFDRRFWIRRPPVYAAPPEPTRPARRAHPTGTTSQSTIGGAR